MEELDAQQTELFEQMKNLENGIHDQQDEEKGAKLLHPVRVVDYNLSFESRQKRSVSRITQSTSQDNIFQDN